MLCRAHEGGVRRREVVFPLFLLSLLGWEAAAAVPLKAHLATRSGGRPQAVGFGVCVYGGSEYSEGDAVATDEQCLNCTCSRGALVCHLRACPPLPDGCVRMEGSGCCPSIVCESMRTQQNVDDAEMSTSTQYPASHHKDEPEGTAIKELTSGANATGCEVEGQHHEEGSSVPEMAGHCEDCICSGGRVQCAPKPCSPAPSDCTPMIVRGEDCCPTRYECPTAPSLALPDIDLGSNFESVLVPPSLEELLNYFGTNSTEETKDDERPMEGGSSHSMDDDTLSATTTHSSNGKGDARKHMAVKGGKSFSEPAKEANGLLTDEVEAANSHMTTTETPTTVLTIPEMATEAITTPTSPFAAEESSAKTEGVEETDEMTTLGQLTTPEAAEAERRDPTREEEATETTEETTEMTTILPTEQESTESNFDDAKVDELLGEVTTNDVDVKFTESNETSDNITDSTESYENMTELNSFEFDSMSPGNDSTESYDEEMGVTDDIFNSTLDFEAPDWSKNDSVELGNDTDSHGLNNSVQVENKDEQESSLESLANQTSVENGSIVFNKTMLQNITENQIEGGNNETEGMSSTPMEENKDSLTTTIVSIDRKKDVDYGEFDYNEPTLPPSLPNLRIIPFVAADAVLDKDKTTDNPIFFEGVPPSLFSPPVETEGGFVPRDPPPILEDRLTDETYKPPGLRDSLPSHQPETSLIRISAAELTTTSKPGVRGDYNLDGGIANATAGPSIMGFIFPPHNHIDAEKVYNPVHTPIKRPSFLDSKISPLPSIPGSLVFYNNASFAPPLAVLTTTNPSVTNNKAVTPPTKIPNFTLVGGTPIINRPSEATQMTSSGGALGSHRRPSDRVSEIPLGPTPPRPSPSTSAPYSVGPNLPPAKPLPPSAVSMAPNTNPPPVGLLKLAGCNIYGRMYRVGRIISELSGPCLECRCTEVGVQCRSLPC